MTELKYNSRMTQYHGDIAKALLHYLKDDSKLEKLRSDGDSKPMREYLKDKLKMSSFSGHNEPSVWYTLNGLELKYEDRYEMLTLSWSQLATLLRNDEFYAKYIHTPPVPAEAAPPEAPETDDLRRARELSQRIQIAAEMAQVNLWDMCCGLKEMRDTKLYKQLGYANFEDYCEQAHGIKKVQAYKYISVAEKYTGEKNVHSSERFTQLGINKLYLLSTLEEEQRAEIVATTDLKKTSAKELEEKIRDLKQQNEKLMGDVDAANKRAEQSDSERREAARKLSIVQTDAEGYLAKIKELKSEVESTKSGFEHVANASKKNYNKYLDEREKNRQLEQRVKDLESRPVEVATQIVEKIPDDYVTRQAYEEMVNNYTAQLDKADEEAIAEKRRAYEEKQELEQKIAELENSPRENSEDTFKLLCQICRHPLNKLALFVYNNPLYSERLKKFIKENTDCFIKEEE